LMGKIYLFLVDVLVPGMTHYGFIHRPVHRLWRPRFKDR